MTWIQRVSSESMDDDALKDYIKESRRLCGLALPKSTQKKFNLV
jgi:predicted DNA-binding protein (MmcQ/YjbR family)